MMKLHSVMFAVLMTMAMAVGQAAAAVINIDWNVGPSDPTHVGADGILSTTGTFWNGLDSAAAGDQGSILTEFGGATPVHVVHVNPLGGLGAGGTNDLQNAGYDGSAVIISGLLANTPYDVAIYLGQNGGIFGTGFGSASGNETVAFGNISGVPLPGVAGQDYFLLSPRFPKDLGGGLFGFTLGGFDGAVVGMQISGAIPEPVSISLLSFGGILLLRRRR